MCGGTTCVQGDVGVVESACVSTVLRQTWCVLLHCIYGEKSQYV